MPRSVTRKNSSREGVWKFEQDMTQSELLNPILHCGWLCVKSQAVKVGKSSFLYLALWMTACSATTHAVSIRRLRKFVTKGTELLKNGYWNRIPPEALPE
jgi:hypothetical protein